MPATERLLEYETKVLALPRDVALALAETPIVSVREARHAGEWIVKADRKVGVVSVPGFTLFVDPKVSVSRLLFLIGYADNSKGWRDDPVLLDADAELCAGTAYYFAHLLEEALRTGLLQGYRTTEATLPALRGRLREQDQLRRRFTLAVPVDVRYDEFDVDTPENQVLRAAVEKLLRVPGLPGTLLTRLRHLLYGFSAVSPLHGGALPLTPLTRLNARYQPALAVARLVLAGDGIDVRAGRVRVTGFCFDMDKVFERFVARAISEALASRGRCELNPSRPLDDAGRLRCVPDVLHHHGERRTAVDAKYKTAHDRHDVYQVLAYAVALGSTRAHLVYAIPQAAPETYVIGDRVVVRHGVDLAQPVALLLAQMQAIADDVAS